MKRAVFLMLAALAALVALLVALDAVNFETDRIDRWVMIFAFGGVAFFLGMATIDTSGGSDASADGAGAPSSSRSMAQRSLAATRPGPGGDAPRPGSLLRTRAKGDEPETEPSLDLGVLDIDEVERSAARSTAATSNAAESNAVESNAAEGDAVDTELQGIIDEEQMEEITALVRLAEALESRQKPTEPIDESEARAFTDSPPASDQDPHPMPASPADPRSTDVEPADQPLARLELRLADYDDEALRQVVKDSEALVIAEMVRTGQLTSSGHLTERDIASMVFLAYTSDEMLAELRLRKALDQPGDVAVTDRALAPLKNIE